MVMCYEAPVSSCLLPKLSSLCLYCPKVKRNSSKLYFSEFWLKLIIVLFLYSWSLFIMITSSPIKLHLSANQRPALRSCDHSRPIRGQSWCNNNKSASLIVKTRAELMTVLESLGSVLYYYSIPRCSDPEKLMSQSPASHWPLSLLLIGHLIARK